MIDLGAMAQAAFAANAPVVASTALRLAAVGFETMRNAREQRVIGELDLERAARRRADDEPVIVIAAPPVAAPKMPRVGPTTWRC